MGYKLDSEVEARRADLSNSSTVSLTEEIILTKTLLEQAINSKQTSTALACLQTLSKLQQAHTQAMFKAGELLQKSAIYKLGKLISAAVADALEGLPDWAVRYEKILDGVENAIITLSNEPTPAPHFTRDKYLLAHERTDTNES